MNLSLRLHKWAHRQDENFMTEIFSFVLQHLVENEPQVACRLLKDLTDAFLNLEPDETKAVNIRTHVSLAEGRPDLEISTPDRLAYLEVKTESDLGTRQLERYRRMLKESGAESTCLVLVTRYPVLFLEGEERPDVAVRWYQIAEWLGRERAGQPFNSAVSTYLVDQFLGFLRARNMSMTQVSWEMPTGLRALRGLLDMIQEALATCDVTCKRIAKWDWIGFYVEGEKYWIGIDYGQPESISFETYKCHINREVAERLGVGEVDESEYAPGGICWRRIENLESEDNHFYARTRASQLQWLERFVKECLDVARHITDQAPGPPFSPTVREEAPDGDANH